MAHTTDYEGDSLTITQGKLSSSDVFNAVTADSSSSSNPTSLTGGYGTLSVGADGSYAYTIDNSNSLVQALNVTQTLIDSFTLQLEDGNGGKVTQELSITINGSNDAPSLTASNLSTDEDQLQSGITVDSSSSNLLNTITDVDNTDNFSIAAINGSSSNIGSPTPVTLSYLDKNGASQTATINLTLQSDGSYSIDAMDISPLPYSIDATGTFTYQIQDLQGGLSGHETATITITGTNDKPVITSANDVIVTEETSATFTHAATDVDNTQLTWSIDTHPFSGTVSLNGDSTFTYTPNINLDTSDVFTLKVTDSNFGTTTQKVHIEITAINDTPVLPQHDPIYPGDEVLSKYGVGVYDQIINLGITDVDTGSVEGLALTGSTQGFSGEWSYSIDNGTSWQPLDNLSTEHAVVLPNSNEARIRYAAGPDHKAGDFQLTAQAWDTTSPVISDQADYLQYHDLSGIMTLPTSSVSSNSIEFHVVTEDNPAPEPVTSSPPPASFPTDSTPLAGTAGGGAITGAEATSSAGGNTSSAVNAPSSISITAGSVGNEGASMSSSPIDMGAASSNQVAGSSTSSAQSGLSTQPSTTDSTTTSSPAQESNSSTQGTPQSAQEQGNQATDTNSSQQLAMTDSAATNGEPQTNTEEGGSATESQSESTTSGTSAQESSSGDSSDSISDSSTQDSGGQTTSEPLSSEAEALTPEGSSEGSATTSANPDSSTAADEVGNGSDASADSPSDTTNEEASNSDAGSPGEDADTSSSDSAADSDGDTPTTPSDEQPDESPSSTSNGKDEEEDAPPSTTEEDLVAAENGKIEEEQTDEIDDNEEEAEESPVEEVAVEDELLEEEEADSEEENTEQEVAEGNQQDEAQPLSTVSTNSASGSAEGSKPPANQPQSSIAIPAADIPIKQLSPQIQIETVEGFKDSLTTPLQCPLRALDNIYIPLESSPSNSGVGLTSQLDMLQQQPLQQHNDLLAALQQMDRPA